METINREHIPGMQNFQESSTEITEKQVEKHTPAE